MMAASGGARRLSFRRRRRRHDVAIALAHTQSRSFPQLLLSTLFPSDAWRPPSAPREQALHHKMARRNRNPPAARLDASVPKVEQRTVSSLAGGRAQLFQRGRPAAPARRRHHEIHPRGGRKETSARARNRPINHSDSAWKLPDTAGAQHQYHECACVFRCWRVRLFVCVCVCVCACEHASERRLPPAVWRRLAAAVAAPLAARSLVRVCCFAPAFDPARPPCDAETAHNERALSRLASLAGVARAPSERQARRLPQSR
jgi:hypothetical protein